MKFEELFEKYQALLSENEELKAEIGNLKAKLGLEEAIPDVQEHQAAFDFDSLSIFESEVNDKESPGDQAFSSINNSSDPKEKIRLFMALFKGREDVYAVRWENPKKGTFGYSPFCLNEWKPGLCRKPKERCVNCTNKLYAGLDEKVIDDHLRGNNNFVAGIYPLCLDETCYFLAIDFDGEEWAQDITVLREVCLEFHIPLAVERSRSGQGAHAWFFFQSPISATLVRRFGSAMLTCAMNKRHDLKFQSYDRLFPNQDTLPKGGLGNLIALPLQKAARKNRNSEFIDEYGNAFTDQWAFLSKVQKLSQEQVQKLTANLSQGNELGELIRTMEEGQEEQKPWEAGRTKLLKSDFPLKLEIVKVNMLFVPKVGITDRGLNHLKRLAAFRNPEFYKAQAMRLSVARIPRIISCSEETAEYICLPRGCETDLKEMSKELEIDVQLRDETNHGNSICVEFNGHLRDEQPLALEKLLKYDNGILSGTTAFGKTVVAIKLIAERKVNTLILVDRVSLVAQWKKRLEEFLIINETLPDKGDRNKRGSKKAKSIIGQLGAGKDNLNGILDIAVMQSLYRSGEVRDCVKNYGMVIIDECHHVSAFSFESILKSVNAKYVYGLTATPTRKDGHHPIIFMQCGPVRYKDDAKKQADRRPFDHYVLPRFTSFKVPLDKEENDVSIQELYSEIVVNEVRNQQIIDDVIKNHESGRNCIVLTERTAHVELLAKKLSERIPDVMRLTGGMGAKETKQIMEQIAETPDNRTLTLVATGKYIGEGFDEPRLDTLFLAMPISWKGTLQQYAGRLHRLFENKSEVQIYDYVDIHIRMLEKMYHKRLNGYAAIGYKAKGDNMAAESVDIIFDKSSFMPVYANDIVNASREIIIVSPFVTRKRSLQMLPNLSAAIENKVKVIVVTRPPEDYKDHDIVALQNTFDLLRNAGLSIVYKSKIHQKFAIVDQNIVWYGSINLLSFGTAEESIMRLESPNIANELIKSISVTMK
ncbi:MAG: DEAD/DEAH box helicase family protein [Peptococcaceae bacterium]|nr:DEAD/DEAH box helicase family protein [Peptococcaceae bacterium]